MKPPDASELPGAGGGTESPAAYGDPLTLARHLLAAANPSTSVAVEGAERVAGRDAYRLVVRPRTDRTLVGRIDIAVDAEHHLPLSVTVTPRSRGRAAFFVRYTSVNFGPIDPAVFRFSPPAGARVESPRPDGTPIPPSLGLVAALGQARTFGSGWATVVAVPVPPAALRLAKGPGLAQLFPFSAPLFSVRVIDSPGRSWVVFGMVPPSALEAVAAELS
jgi:hypothetical protein